MRLIKKIISFTLLLFIIGCAPQIVTKYQCQNGQVVDSIEMCNEQRCPPLPKKVCTTVKEPYVEKIPYNYTFSYGVVSDSTLGTLLDIDNWGTEQITKIKNFDEKQGYFTVKHHYRTLKKEGDREVSHYSNSSETKEFKTTFDTALGEDVEVSTTIIPPTEIRYKEVIKYKEVERCSCE